MDPGQRPTLPPIRDIFAEELSRSPKPPPQRFDSTFSLEVLNSALSDDDRTYRAVADSSPASSPGLAHINVPKSNPGLRSTSGHTVGPYARFDSRMSTPTSTCSNSQPSTASSQFMITPPPHRLHNLPPLMSKDFQSSRRSSVASTSETYSPREDSWHRSKSYSFSGGVDWYGDSAGRNRELESTLLPDIDRRIHARRDPRDFSPSRSSTHDTHAHTPPQSFDALQFHPFSHTSFPSSGQTTTSTGIGHHHMETPPTTMDYVSPFGIMTSDGNLAGCGPAAEPQQLALLRGLRTSISHPTLSVNYFDPALDPRAIMFPPARYECSYCAKRFNRPSSLKIHLNTHTGEKPFQCSHPGCGRCFSVQSNMRRHARIHAQNSQQAQESSGEEISEDAPSQSATPLIGSPASLCLEFNTEETSDLSNKSLTPGPTTPQAKVVPRTRAGGRGRLLAHTQHMRSVSNDEMGHRSVTRSPRSRSSSTDDETRPGKRSRRSSNGPKRV